MFEPTANLGFKLLHIGVAVPSLDESSNSLRDLFGYTVISGPFDDPVQKVRVTFLALGQKDVAEIELIAPLADNSPVQAMLKRGSGGAYHLCYETSDIDAALKHAEENGCVIVAQPVPAVAFGGRKIAWFYTPSRQLFELVEAKPEE